MAPSIKYAIYYPEGGYLHVRTLGSGVQGCASLVQSVANGALYVRKKTIPEALQPNSQSNTCAEVSLYRPHPRIPKLIRSQEYPVMKSSDPRQAALKTHSMIFEYCNGGTLTRFLHIRADDDAFSASTMLVWKLFDDLLSAVYFLHQQCTPAIAHNDAHTSNVFLHFPDEHAKVPDFYLGDLGYAKTIDAGMWKGGGGANPGERKLRNINSVTPATRDIYNEYVKLLVNDLISVQNNVGALMAGLTSYDVVPPHALTGQMKASRRWPAELFECYDKLEYIIYGMAWGGSPERYADFPELRRLVRNFRREEQARVLGKTKDFRGTRPGRYDWDKIGELDGDVGAEIATEHKKYPKLFDSRHQLLVNARTVPGPWRIAHVDPHTFAVLGVEKLEFGYHMPTMRVWEGDADGMLETNVERSGWDKILKTARSVDEPERLSGRPFQPDKRDSEVAQLFGLDRDLRG